MKRPHISLCLSLALRVCLMRELGFTTEQITPIIRKHEDYKLIPFLQPRVNLEKLTS